MDCDVGASNKRLVSFSVTDTFTGFNGGGTDSNQMLVWYYGLANGCKNMVSSVWKRTG
jgi:hypothetical protein